MPGILIVLTERRGKFFPKAERNDRHSKEEMKGVFYAILFCEYIIIIV